MSQDHGGPLPGPGKTESDDEAGFRLLVETVREYAIFMLDPSGRVKSWNAGAAHIKGYRAEEIVGQPYAVFFPEALRLAGEPERLLARAERDGQALADGPRVRKDGTHFDADATLTALRDGDGTLRGFAKITRDVTERRRAQTERETLARALAAQKRLLDLVLDQLPVGVSLLRAPDGRPLRSNRAFDALWRGGAPQGDLFRADGRPLPREESPVAQVLRTGQPVADAQLGIVRGDGTRAVTLQSAAPVVDERGALAAVVLTVVDISRRAEAEGLLERFVGVLGHDLRGPLQVISLSMASLMKPDLAHDVRRRHVLRVTGAANTMQRMLADLTDLTQGRLAGGFPISPATMNLSVLAGQVVDELEVEFPQRPVALFAPPLIEGCWDGVRLHQLVHNLLRYALRRAADGVPVRLWLFDEPEQARLVLEHASEILSPADRADLFTPFRAGRSDDPQDLGLGLYIVQEIARAHGGAVEVRSQAPGGTTFEVCLPRLPPPEKAPRH